MATNGIRTRNIFDPDAGDAFKLSRSKIELFIQCPRCFYLDRRLGIARPDGPAFTLNVAVDALLKKEFDVYRAKGEHHPLMEQNGVDAIPFAHPELDDWRDAWKGIQVEHKESGFLVTGAVDDLWIDERKDLIVVDYKATSAAAAPTIDTPGRMAYKRQMEIYQWLFRKNGFSVSDIAYFVFANGDKARGIFEATLHFDMTLIAYHGSDAWVEEALLEAKECLHRALPPPAAADCGFCQFAANAGREFTEKPAGA
jgi:RecB family exonuclease